MLQKRGKLTERIKAKSKELLGYEISVRELRLMPYVLTCMMNDQRIDPRKVSGEERDILATWRQKGWIEGGAGGLGVTIDFWNAICEIVRLGYVDLSE